MLCYNIGCGKKFELTENTEKSCIYHVKPPVFHDGKKGWECCKRYSTDFSTCLSTPGCQVGFHNPDKPKEPVKPQIDPKYDVEVVVVNPIEKRAERPSGDDEMSDIRVVQLSSLQTEITKKKQTMIDSRQNNNDENSIPLGTSCKNTCCSRKYNGSETNKEICIYHSGEAVFHEGMKFWTCCLRRTSDFDAFMAQEGCTSGKHIWWKQPSSASCKYDWFQSGGGVTISLYAKLVLPETLVIKANAVKLSVSFHFDCGTNQYEKVFDLFEAIDVSASHVKVGASKVEILLKKKTQSIWNSLEFSVNKR